MDIMLIHKCNIACNYTSSSTGVFSLGDLVSLCVHCTEL